METHGVIEDRNKDGSRRGRPARFCRWKADGCVSGPARVEGARPQRRARERGTRAGSHAGGTSYRRKRRFGRTDCVLSCRTHRLPDPQALSRAGGQVAGTDGQLPVLSLKETEVSYL